MSQHIFKGTTAPATTPLGVGHHYINTATGDSYISVGTSSSADWKIDASSSDVVGPASSTDNALARFDGVTGKIIQDSTSALDDSGNLSVLSATHSSATASTVPVYDGSKKLVSSAVTPTELGYVSGVTSALQTQIDSKAPQASLDAHVNDTTDAHDASAISSVAAGNLAATNVQTALDELQSDVDTRALNSDLTAHVSDATDAHDASAISNIASGNLAATDIQGAVNELQSDIDTRALASRTITAGVGLSGGGDLSADRTLDFDANDITTLSGSTDTAADFVPIYDASGAVTRKVLISNLGAALAATTLTAGIGLSGGGDLSTNRTIDLDVNDITSETAPVAGDSIPFYDLSATATRKATIAQINAAIDHGVLVGNADDDHTQYPLLVGRSGGQTLTGGTASGDDLTLRSTTNGTKGNIIIDETTAATSPTTGALIVGGGVGIAGSLGLGGALYLGSGNLPTITSNTSVASTVLGYLLDSSGGAFNVTLPDPATRQCVLLIGKTGNLGTNPVTVVRFGSETICGVAASKVLSTNFGQWLFVSDGTNWSVS